MNLNFQPVEKIVKIAVEKKKKHLNIASLLRQLIWNQS